MAPRPKPRTTTKEPVKANAFLEALKFLSAITKDKGAPFETHIYLNNGYAMAFDGVIAAGCKITEDIFACPHNGLLIEALSKCGEHISITQLDNGRLSIKSDKFKAIVPCLDPTLFQVPTPDMPIAIIDDKLKIAMDAVEVLANEDGLSVVTASILLNRGSAIATNRSVIFEYWHGIDLPNGLSIPKALVKAVTKCSKKLTKFGFSQSSVTFYFEDDSWFKSQLYADPWPDIAGVLEANCNPWPVPADFFKGLASVAPFSPDGLVHFGNGLILSHPDGNAGASYEVAGLPKGPVFSAKQLLLLKDHAEKIDFMAKGQNGMTFLMFYGPNIRGAIAGREESRYVPAVTLSDEQRKMMDDNIPF